MSTSTTAASATDEERDDAASNGSPHELLLTAMNFLSPFVQTERFKVERYKQLRDQPGRPWAWVTVGYFNAGTMAEARAMARDAIADKICLLRAIPVGKM